MTDLLQKARAGRNSALAGLSVSFDRMAMNPDSDVRFRTTRRVDVIPFVSKRPQINSAVWLH